MTEKKIMGMQPTMQVGLKSDNAVLKWSPNSDKIATFQQDARGVGMMYLASTNVGHLKIRSMETSITRR